MKKIYSLVLLVAGVFSWGSCSLDEVNPNNSGQFSDGSYTLETYKAPSVFDISSIGSVTSVNIPAGLFK